ncbi:MAG: VWA domain-containing protein [Spirosomataceae bacterium]
MTQDWFSAHWFTWDTLSSFEWANPYFLYGVIGVPLLYLFRWLFLGKSQQRLPMAFVREDIRTSWVSYLRHLPAILMCIAITLLLVVLARPQKVSEQTDRSAEGIDIVLALDISESMQERDVLPNRLEAAKKVAANFIKGRFQDRIGLVVFAGDAFTLCPPTTDYEALYAYLADIKPSLVRESGTAIGKALGVCINRLRDTESKSKVAILISDGDNTAGELDPVMAAQLARAYGVRVYAIAIGRITKTMIQRDSTTAVSTAVDEGMFRQITSIAQGQAFRARDAQALSGIFAQINQLEKVKIKSTQYKDVQDVYHTYLRWAILFWLLAFMAKTSFIGNILED